MRRNTGFKVILARRPRLLKEGMRSVELPCTFRLHAFYTELYHRIVRVHVIPLLVLPDAGIE